MYLFIFVSDIYLYLHVLLYFYRVIKFVSNLDHIYTYILHFYTGKTTLMDVLSGRKNTGVVKGEMFVNGRPKQELHFRRNMG